MLGGLHVCVSACLPALQSAGSLKGAAEVNVVPRRPVGVGRREVRPLVHEVPLVEGEGLPGLHVEVPAPSGESWPRDGAEPERI